MRGAIQEGIHIVSPAQLSEQLTKDRGKELTVRRLSSRFRKRLSEFSLIFFLPSVVAVPDEGKDMREAPFRQVGRFYLVNVAQARHPELSGAMDIPPGGPN